MRFSFTRLDTYRRCPFQYKLRYQHHLPGQPRPGTRLALALHAALAAFYRDRTAMPHPDDLLRTFEAQWPDELAERDFRAIEEGRALLVDYFRRQGDAWPKVRFVEEPFRLELGRHVLVGTLDRVDELPDGTLRIVDYKTARTPPQAPDTFQLDIYQLGLAAKTGELASHIVFEYLRHGTQHVVEVDDRNIRPTLDRMGDVLAAVGSATMLPTALLGLPSPSRSRAWRQRGSSCSGSSQLRARAWRPHGRRSLMIYYSATAETAATRGEPRAPTARWPPHPHHTGPPARDAPRRWHSPPAKPSASV
ncbi:MAG TPA: PD-(D/E)XK nuclease family protein [Chloroflexota bacterium]|jgi:RecB family exonuclease